MLRNSMRWPLLTAVLLLTACDDETSDTSAAGGETAAGGSSSSDGGSTSEGGAGTTSSSGGAEMGGASAGLTFAGDVWPLLTMDRDPPLSGDITSCNGCHATGAGGLSMPDVDTALANLLGTPSTSGPCGDTLRVVPGDPDASCFVIFYENRLRDELGWVEQAETDLVRAWVASGAAP